MNRLKTWLSARRSVAHDESGQGLAEYALILALIALVCVAALVTLGQAIANSPGFTVLPGNL
jgi:pilus assembly protein Flp/PilA